MRTKNGHPFNMYMPGPFVSYYSMKGDQRYAYDGSIEDENPSYTHSQQAVDLNWEKI